MVQNFLETKPELSLLKSETLTMGPPVWMKGDRAAGVGLTGPRATCTCGLLMVSNLAQVQVLHALFTQ